MSSAAATEEELAALPEVGQVVRVRARHWAVADIAASTLSREHTGIHRRQHLVTLRALDDDAAPDETLRVIWEVEPDGVVVERGELPTPDAFDDPTRFDAFLDAVRWGATARADTTRQLELLAPFRSGIDVDAYQLEPVARALRMPRVALLCADDVGLGKTIEAGLVAQELVLRYRARRILILSPADLLLQWQGEMQDRFGLRFVIVNKRYVSELRRERGPNVNPFEASNRLIVSYDWLKAEAQLRRFRETLPGPGESTFPRRWDLLILDEAHNVAPSGRGRSDYAQDTQRTRLVREIAPHFEHRLFLTATPHNGYDESFSALLELLDDSRFARSVTPSADELDRVMVRRMKSELRNEDGTPRFPARRVEPIVIDPSDDERAAYESLGRYLASRRERADKAQRTATEFVALLLKKRFLSSPRAFLDTLRTHRETLARGRATPVPATVAHQRVLQERIDRLAQGFETEGELEQATVETQQLAARTLPTLSDVEAPLLDELEQWAERALVHPDAKASALIAALEERCRVGGEWGDERLIVFTEYRATQDWLFDLLAARGLCSDGRVEKLYGGMDTDARTKVKEAFQAPPDRAPVRVLLATDAASEGINLQNHCAWVVHVEIPWNPNRLEQRNGRVDRRGQSRGEVLIQHFAPRGYEDARSSDDALDGDLIFLDHAARKIERMRERLGSVGTVLAEQVEEAMLGKRSELDTLREEREPDPLAAVLTRERDLAARLRDLVERLDEYRHEMRLDDYDHIRVAVDTALELAGQPRLIQGPIPGSWRVGALSGAWERGRAGLHEPYPLDPRNPRERPIVFDPALLNNDEYVYAHLEHPLIAMSLRRLRAEVWASERSASGTRLERVTARLVASPELEAPLALVHARLVVTGSSGHRLHEEIVTAGGLAGIEHFERLNVTQLTELTALPDDGIASAEARARLRTTHAAIAPQLQAALDARARERRNQVAETVERRGREEANRIRDLFAELERSIRIELDREPPPQLSLWGEDDRRSRDADQRHLQARLTQIPDQAAAEAVAAAQRYADPVHRLFPVAVEYRIPKGWPG